MRRLSEWAGRARPRYRPPGIRYLAVALVGLLVIGGGAIRLTDDDSAAKTHHRGPKQPRPKIKPGDVTVAVLNGTTVDGLAAALRDRLAAAGFRQGTIDVFSDQQLAESVVQYAPGHQAAAKAVGRRLGISAREPVTATSRALAGDATVIVIAGADQAP